MRRYIAVAALAIFSLLLSVIAGCDMLDLDLKLDLDYSTTVKASGDIIQEIRCEITGMTGTMLEEIGLLEGSDFTADFEQDGWALDVERTDDSVIVTATGSFTMDEDIIIPQVEGGPAFTEGFSVRVEDGLLSKKYFAEFNAAESGDELIGEGGGLGGFTDMMLGDMFDFSWTITLPGKIVESNADSVEGSSATWDFDIDSLSSGLNLTVHSQYTNWPVIGGIIAGVVVVLVLAAFFFIRRRRAPASFPSEIAD